MGKHTPGPWKNDSNAILAQFEGQEVQIASIAQTSWSHPDRGKTQRLRAHKEANAALIAAAPDLLEALHELLKDPSDDPLYAQETEDGYCLTPRQIAERKARAAIAKATASG